jgi:hypothetical protein
MREIRIFELDRPGVPVSWRSARAQTIAAQAGLLWVTQEDQLQDIWLKPGQSIDVPAGVRFWLSGEPGCAPNCKCGRDKQSPEHPITLPNPFQSRSHVQSLQACLFSTAAFGHCAR